MRQAYLGDYQDTIPIGIYAKFLPRGTVERMSRTRGVGLIDFYPPVSLMSPPWLISQGHVSEVKHCEFSIQYAWESGTKLQERRFHTPVGDVSQIVKRDTSGIGSEHIVKHYITEKEDYKVVQYIVENTLFKSNSDDFESIEQNLGSDGVVLSRIDRSGYQKLLIELVNPKRFFFDYYDYPELIDELIETIDAKGDEQLKLVLDQGKDLIWQIDNISADMTPPQVFEKYHLPLYAKRQKLIKKCTGGAYIIHTDGKTTSLSSLFNQIGQVVIESFSLPCIGGDMELEDVKLNMPAHKVFPNFPSNWTKLEREDLKNHCEDLHARLQTLEHPTMIEISEDIPEYAYMEVLPILKDVFSY